MSEKIIVTFTKSWCGYGVDETAGFDPAVAQGLISSGVAEKYNPAEADKSGAPAKKGGRAAKKPPPTEGADSGGGASTEGGSGDDDESKP